VTEQSRQIAVALEHVKNPHTGLCHEINDDILADHEAARTLTQVIPAILLDELADAVAGGTRKEYMESVATVPLLIIDDFGMRKLPHTAAEDLLEIIMRRYERFSTLLTSNRPVEDWGKLLGDVAAVSARSLAASRSCAQVWPAELAHQVVGNWPMITASGKAPGTPKAVCRFLFVCVP
jgi:hypothetical protein